nr:nitrogen assimilation transcription factor nit-4 [Quercus suber]POE94328.1 nitrogen assimilation transcription factor nit-4 [Quercus suber]
MSAHQHRHSHEEHDDPGSGRGRKKPQRSIVRVACNACRSRKIGCDASRPTCSACHGSGRRCVYDTQNDEETRAMALRRENAHLQFEVRELNGILRSLAKMPDQEVLNYIRRYPTAPVARNASRVASSSTSQDMPLPLDLPEHGLISGDAAFAPDLGGAPPPISASLQPTSRYVMCRRSSVLCLCNRQPDGESVRCAESGCLLPQHISRSHCAPARPGHLLLDQCPHSDGSGGVRDVTLLRDRRPKRRLFRLGTVPDGSRHPTRSLLLPVDDELVAVRGLCLYPQLPRSGCIDPH